MATLKDSTNQMNENKIISYVTANLENAKALKRHVLVKKFNFSTSDLQHIFLHSVGCSLAMFVIRVKLERAKKLLEGTDMEIDKVAALLGWDRYLFYSRYKGYFGVHPRTIKFRKEFAKVPKEWNLSAFELKLLKLKKFEGLKCREIADKLKMSPDVVSRELRALANKLKGDPKQRAIKCKSEAERIKLAKVYIAKNLDSSNLLSDIKEKFGIRRSLELLRETKMEIAESRMRRKGANIINIALALGYTDTRHFKKRYRAFIENK